MAEYLSTELKNIGKFAISGDSSSGILIFFSPRANRLLNDVFAQFSAISHLGTNKLKPRTKVSPVTDEQCAAVSEWLQLMEHQHQRSFSFSTSLGPLTMIQRRPQSDRRLSTQDAQTLVRLLHTITGASVGDEVNWLSVHPLPDWIDSQAESALATALVIKERKAQLLAKMPSVKNSKLPPAKASLHL